MMYNESMAREAQNEDKNPKQRARTSSHNTYIEKATRDYSRVIHMFPGNYLLYLYRGRLLLKQGYEIVLELVTWLKMTRKMKEATYDFHAAFELNAGIAQTFVQVHLFNV